jgi:hypothetical protein
MPIFARRRDSALALADLFAFAAQQAADARRRYNRLAGAAWEHGNHELAELFETLGKRESAEIAPSNGEAERVRRLLPQALTNPAAATEDAMRSALLTPYRALALAVQEAQQGFAVYAQIAALAQPSAVRQQAENLARKELARAAALRQARRRAYHAERPSALPGPSTLAELHALTPVWEAGTETGAPDQARRLAQAFERYLSLAERAENEEVLAEAQARATEILRRILAGTA